MNENTNTCPMCPRGCSLSAPSCPRGRNYAQNGGEVQTENAYREGNYEQGRNYEHGYEHGHRHGHPHHGYDHRHGHGHKFH